MPSLSTSTPADPSRAERPGAGVTTLVHADLAAWSGDGPRPDLQRVIEHGGVVVCERLAFPVSEAERTLFDRAIGDAKRKSIYLRTGRSHVAGTSAEGAELATLTAMIERYADACHTLVGALFPAYDPRRHATGTSFRPRAIGDLGSGRAMSWRKDDTRLHVDAFPSNPTQGDRILRVFNNAHPGTLPRSWRVGEPFEAMASRYLAKTRGLPPAGAWLMHRLGITKRPRSAYDHAMLQLHDLAKADLDYQRTSPQQAVDFAPGTTWICFSDQVMHAAMSGRFMFEQTYRLPLSAIAEPEASPLRVLERLAGRPLA